MLNEGQKKALNLLMSGDNVFLSGEAGTGKSYVIDEFTKKENKKNILLCAPTGIAAINIKGITLHRAFGIKISEVIKKEDYNHKPSEELKLADVIIIDEISMCRFDVFNYICKTLENMNDKKRQIVVVGDFYQLSPVIKDIERKCLLQYWDKNCVMNGYAFLSEYWGKLNFKSIVLTEIVRQKGEADYIKNLNLIRRGIPIGIDWFNNNSSIERISNAIYLCGTNEKANIINNDSCKKIEKKPKKYYADIKGLVDDNEKPTVEELELKVGMQVMSLVNDKADKYKNGTLGEIVSLDDDFVKVKFNSGNLVEIKYYTWDIYGYKRIDDQLEKIVIGKFKQIPLKVAYAITIHKSQGQTYDEVNISPECFANGQLYVALSRAKSIKKLHLEHKIHLYDLKVSETVKRFYRDILKEGK